MENKFREFWIEQFNGHGGLKAYYSEPERMNVKLHINDRPQIPAYNYYRVVEYSALESANAENKELTDEITALKKELKSKNDSYSDRLNKYWQNHTSIEGFKKENKKLADENAKVTKILNWLVFHAIDTASISKAKGAELLGIPLIDMDNYRNSLDMK